MLEVIGDSAIQQIPELQRRQIDYAYTIVIVRSVVAVYMSVDCSVMEKSRNRVWEGGPCESPVRDPRWELLHIGFAFSQLSKVLYTFHQRAHTRRRVLVLDKEPVMSGAGKIGKSAASAASKVRQYKVLQPMALPLTAVGLVADLRRNTQCSRLASGGGSTTGLL